MAIAVAWPGGAWPGAAQTHFLHICEDPNGAVQGTRAVCRCLLEKFEAHGFPPLPSIPFSISYLTRPPVPYWYKDNTGQCGVG